MPLFLEQPTYPRGPDGRGWNRLSLNAHFDRRHQCGLQPTRFAALYEALTGRQHWGGFGRCFVGHPGSCGSCPVQLRRLAREGGINWPDETPLLLARVRPWPLTPGALFADPASGRSSLELSPWRGGQPVLDADWVEILNTPGLLISWCWQDEQGEAFWLVRSHPAADTAIVHTERIGAGLRHELYGGPGLPRLAVLTCHGCCAHEGYHLRHLAADLAHRPDRAPALGTGTETPGRLPGVPLVDLARVGSSSVIRRARSRSHGPSTVQIGWDVPFDETTVTALAAYAVRLVAI
ncbi:hypothetical protein DMH25_07870 [Streptomyces sp. WAC 01325]|uniref:hypothetical protein n=1 Tax=Streptomyces sp. WAC 01325 TaxID=2203202 RepID=UPI000F8710BF|nr:hypothetical protein [Streptomyces sp. WAC 01325]RSN14843.1 hypothetical protein DMH25_07870 [Streptomyces sp. WAC 01325]